MVKATSMLVPCRNLSEGITAGCLALDISPRQAWVRLVERGGRQLLLEVGTAPQAAGSEPRPAPTDETSVAGGSATVSAGGASGERWYKVAISDDGLEASLTLYGSPSGEPSAVPSAEEVRKALQQEGVVKGVDEAALASALALFVPGRTSVVAHGQAPRHGVGSRLQRAVDEKDPGVIDGQLVATISPPDYGEAGYTVTGRELPAHPPGPAEWSAGGNVRLSDDGQEVRATAAGLVHYVNGIIEVEGVLRVPGDVDFAAGVISSPGSVVVEGNVQAGATVLAGGDLTILGLAEGAILEAGGNLTVRQGIRGGSRCRVKAGRALAARFLENVTAEAVGDVVAEAILSGRVVSGGRVLCLEGRGMVAGGSVRAKEAVLAKVIGSPLQVSTEIEVGNDQVAKDRLGQTAESFRETEATLAKVEQVLSLLRDGAQRGTISEANKATVLRLARQRLELLRRLQEVSAEKKSLEEQMAGLKRCRIEAREALHPGVRVVLGRAVWEAKDLRSGCALSLDEAGLVRCDPLPDVPHP